MCFVIYILFLLFMQMKIFLWAITGNQKKESENEKQKLVT
jgi:hypothetical protein